MLTRAVHSTSVTVRPPHCPPVTVCLRPEETAAVEEHHDLFARLGITVEVVGPALVRVATVPALGRAGDPEQLFRDVLSVTSGGDAPQAHKAVAERLACSLAIKSGRALSPDEASALLAQAAGGADLATCPHGRPTRLRLTFSQLEKHFDRK